MAAVTLNVEQEQYLLQQLFCRIIPILPQVVRENVKPVIRQLINEEDSIFDTTARSPSTLDTTMQDADWAAKCMQSNNYVPETTAFSELDRRLTAVESKTDSAASSLQKLDEGQISLATQVEQFADLNLPERVSNNEREITDHTVQLDKQEAYTRQYILQLEEIPNNGSWQFPEDCIKVVRDFLWYRLKINVGKYDISIAHRQIHPNEKKRLGRNYIPPIYCKFVNRHVVFEILKRRHLLKNQRNIYGTRFTITQNTTLKRRELWDSVVTKLASYKRKWRRNGKIFVKKSHKSPTIKITSDHVLQKLLKADTGAREPHRQPSEVREIEDPVTSSAEKQVADRSAHTENGHVAEIEPTPADRRVPPRELFPRFTAPSQSKVSSSPPRFPHPSTLRYPPPFTRRPNPTTLRNFRPLYSHIVPNSMGYKYTPYERYQLGQGNRNCLLSPNEQRLMQQATSYNSVVQHQYFDGVSRKSRPFSH